MALIGSFSTSSYDGRYYHFSWTATQDVANNCTHVSWSLGAYGGDAWYAERTVNVNIDGANVYNKSARVERYAGVFASGTRTISHDTNGYGYMDVYVEAAVYTSAISVSGSSRFVFDSIPRKSTLSVSDGRLTTQQTLTVYRQSTAFTHTVTWGSGNYGGTICDKSTATTLYFTPPIELAFGAPNGTSVYVGFTITTYNGSNAVGSNSYGIWCHIPSAIVPVISSLSVSDYNGYYGVFGAYIQGRSRFSISVSASGVYYSSITSYSISANGTSYGSSSVTTNVIGSSGTSTISASVTDSRGRSASASQNVTVLPYSNPKITSLSVKRCDSEGNSSSSGAYLIATFSWEISPLNNKNSKAFKLKFKKKSTSTYEEVNLAEYYNAYSQSGAYIFSADTASSYDVQLEVADYFTSTTATQTGPATSKLFSFLKRGLGIALGKVAELENTFEVDFFSRFYKKVSIGSNENVQLYEDGDGGNIRLLSNLGNAWQMHVGNDTFHLYNYMDYKPLTYSKDGVLNTESDITTSSGHRLSEKLTKYSWTAILKSNSWNRICYIPCHSAVSGCSGIIGVTFTRSNVVGNATFSFNASHHSQCRITNLGSNYYTQMAVRGVTDQNGDVYIEILEAYDSGTMQSANCTFIPIIAGTPQLYTVRVSGGTVPDGFSASAALTLSTQQPYTKVEFYATLSENSYVQPFTYYGLVSLATYNNYNYGYLIHACARDTSAAPVPCAIDSDGADVRVVSTSAKVLIILTYMRPLST